MTDRTDRHPFMPPQAFAQLGGDRFAYIRRIASEDVSRMFPDVPDMAPGLKLWALLSADGSPILISDNRDAVVANAAEHDLQAVSVH